MTVSATTSDLFFNHRPTEDAWVIQESGEPELDPALLLGVAKEFCRMADLSETMAEELCWDFRRRL